MGTSYQSQPAQTSQNDIPKLVRETSAGRAIIAREIARLQDWCQRTETPWFPVSPQEVEG